MRRAGSRLNVVAAVIRDRGRVFATQRGYGENKDGWEFPGGKIEHGETPQQALVREIEEDLDSVDWLPADRAILPLIRDRLISETWR